MVNRVIYTYLVKLQGKIFKLLPMREAHDAGAENHLEEYLKNLCTTYAGAFTCYPELAMVGELAEVYGNIAFLSNNSVTFSKWRSIVLRSTRLMQAVASRYAEEV